MILQSIELGSTSWHSDSLDLCSVESVMGFRVYAPTKPGFGSMASPNHIFMTSHFNPMGFGICPLLTQVHYLSQSKDLFLNPRGPGMLGT
jgi:hypothetical protein